MSLLFKTASRTATTSTQRHLANSTRSASILSHAAHLRTQNQKRNNPEQQQLLLLHGAKQHQHQYQHQHQQRVNSGISGLSREWVFRHRGPAPEAPQAMDTLQFILGERPLAKGGPVAAMESEREVARRQLGELNAVVVNAQGVMAALTKCSEKYLANASIETTKAEVATEIEAKAVTKKSKSSSATATATATAATAAAVGLGLASALGFAVTTNGFVL
ncbi:hypothetical protein LPJ66_003117 [Kickxella alabastrina]|uniref:Uncharacterized protein n=1 Tax=Kickxella alabastrina TaxID=61397 RepID=A0ACC1INI2_9FUNG|nr:hypothetical protein LPJ66_003117 [Kickxella alabastrina]